MLNHATADSEQFYVSGDPGSALKKVIDSMELISLCAFLVAPSRNPIQSMRAGSADKMSLWSRLLVQNG